MRVTVGLNAASSLICLTALLANGSRWAFAVERVGSVSIPVLGGTLIAMKSPLQEIFLLLPVLLGIGTVANAPR